MSQRRVFISYSHRDEEWKDRLVGHLRDLARKGEIDVWHDRLIEAGADWQTRIQAAIDSADTAILLISADFLNSPFIQQEEVARILQRRAEQGLQVIPVIARPCAWTGVEWLRDLQARPLDGRPLSSAAVHEAESDLAALALEIYPRPRWVRPLAASAHAVRSFGFALLPVAVAAAVVLSSMAVRVTTPLQLDIVARAVSFTVAGTESIPLLNNSVPFAKLLIEQCDVVSFPPLSVSSDGITPVAMASAVSFRCDQRVPGAKVLIRATDAETPTGSPALLDAQLVHAPVDAPSRALGTLGRILAKPGDRVALVVTAANPPEIRVEVSRMTSFDFILRNQVPFEIVSEFAEPDGISLPRGGSTIGTYRAMLADSSALRVATAEASHGVRMVFEPARDADVAHLFRADVGIPIDALSLFRSDVDGRIVSTTIRGTLRYPGRSEIEDMEIDTGENVALGDVLSGSRLTQLWIDPKSAGLSLRFEGPAAVTTDGIDRRLTLLDRVVSDRNLQLLGIIAAIASQVAWLRRYPWPRRPLR
jgi:hypothetical protein